MALSAHQPDSAATYFTSFRQAGAGIEARSRSFSPDFALVGIKARDHAKKQALAGSDGPVIAAQLPVISVSSNGPASSLRSFYNERRRHPISPSCGISFWNLPVAWQERDWRSMRVSPSAIARSPGTQTEGGGRWIDKRL
jgi:hypothetical protein